MAQLSSAQPRTQRPARRSALASMGRIAPQRLTRREPRRNWAHARSKEIALTKKARPRTLQHQNEAPQLDDQQPVQQVVELLSHLQVQQQSKSRRAIDDHCTQWKSTTPDTKAASKSTPEARRRPRRGPPIWRAAATPFWKLLVCELRIPTQDSDGKKRPRAPFEPVGLPATRQYATSLKVLLAMTHLVLADMALSRVKAATRAPPATSGPAGH